MIPFGKRIGKVTHYYPNIGVSSVRLDDHLQMGEMVRFKGGKTDFNQFVEEMEYNHAPVKVGKKGQEIGVRVLDRVQPGDDVYLVSGREW